MVDEDEACDGLPPAGLTCVDAGFDFGSVGCSSGCVPDTTPCGAFSPLAFAATTSQIRDVVSVAPGEWLAATSDGLARWKDQTWTTLADGDLYAIDRRGVAVAAAGADGQFLLFDQQEWSSLTVADADLTDVCLTSRGTLVVAAHSAFWVVGDQVVPTATELVLDSPRCVVTKDSEYLWSDKGLFRWTGADWLQTAVPVGATAVSTSPIGELVAVAGNRLFALDEPSRPWIELARYPETIAFTRVTGNLRGEFVLGDDDDTIVVYRAGRWYAWRAPSADVALLVTDITGDFIAGAQQRLWQLTPNLWSSMSLSAERIWSWRGLPTIAVGNHLFQQATGRRTQQTLASMPARVAGFDSQGEQAFVADETGNIAALRGGDASLAREGEGEVLTDLSFDFAVGRNGVILERATGWRPASLDVKESLLAVFTDARGETVAVGHNGVLCHFRDGSWTVQFLDRAVTLTDVWRSEDGGDWIVSGSDGFLATYNGTTATRIPTNTTAALKAIAGYGRANIFVLGDQGAAFHFDGGSWQPMKLPAESRPGEIGVNGTSDEMFFLVGGSVYSLLSPALGRQ